MAREFDARVLRRRDAGRPGDAGPRGWLAIAKCVQQNLGRHNASLIAAGLALYTLLAAFPALAAAVALYGLIASPDRMAVQFEALASIFPAEATMILSAAMQSLAAGQRGALGLGALAGILIALWSARNGMSALMKATNIAYGEEERRPFLRQVAVSLGLTLGAVLGFLLLLTLAVVVPLALRALSLPGILEPAVAVMRWLALWLFITSALAVVYRYAPDHDRPRWRWVTWGSSVAATVWLIASLLFSLYVQNFGTYGETYGALGGVVVLLLWLYLTGYVVMLGAEINAAVEYWRGHDPAASTSRRNAERTDTLGHSPI